MRFCYGIMAKNKESMVKKSSPSSSYIPPAIKDRLVGSVTQMVIGENIERGKGFAAKATKLVVERMKDTNADRGLLDWVDLIQKEIDAGALEKKQR